MANIINYQIDFSSNISVVQKAIEAIRKDIASLSKTSLFGENSLKGLKAAQLVLEKMESSTGVKGLNTGAFISKLTKTQSLTDISSSLLNAGAYATYEKLTSAILKTTEKHQLLNKAMREGLRVFSQSAKYFITNAFLSTVTNQATAAFQQVEKLDKIMTNMAITTGMSGAEVVNVFKDMQSAAIDLRVSMTELGETTTIFLNQGLSLEESFDRATIAIKAAHAAGQNFATMADQLTALWNTYQLTGLELERSAAVLHKIAISTATDFKGLSEAFSIAASSAAQMGVSYESLAAMIATISSTTKQSESVVGNALKTIFSRMEDLKLGTDESGESLGKISSKLSAFGFSILTVDGQLKPLESTISNIGERWSTLSKSQQVAIAELIGGTRQYGQALALFNNWDTGKSNSYTSALKLGKEETGTSLDIAQEKYVDSYEAKVKKLETTWQVFFQKFLSPDLLKAMVDSLQVLSDIIQGIIEVLSNIPTLLGVVFLLFSSKIIPAVTSFFARISTEGLSFTEKFSSGYALAKKMQETNKELAEYEEKINTAMKERERTLERILLLEEEINDLNERKARKVEERNEVETKKAEISSQLDQKQEELEALPEQLSEEEIEEIIQTSPGDAMAEWEEAQQKRIKDIKELKDEIAKLEEELATLDEEIEKKDEEIAKFEEDITYVSSEKKTQESFLSFPDRKSNVSGKILKENEAGIEKLAKKMQELKGRIPSEQFKKLEDNIQGLNAQNVNLIKSVDQQDKAFGLLEVTIKEIDDVSSLALIPLEKMQEMLLADPEKAGLSLKNFAEEANLSEEEMTAFIAAMERAGAEGVTLDSSLQEVIKKQQNLGKMGESDDGYVNLLREGFGDVGESIADIIEKSSEMKKLFKETAEETKDAQPTANWMGALVATVGLVTAISGAVQGLFELIEITTDNSLSSSEKMQEVLKKIVPIVGLIITAIIALKSNLVALGAVSQSMPIIAALTGLIVLVTIAINILAKADQMEAERIEGIKKESAATKELADSLVSLEDKWKDLSKEEKNNSMDSISLFRKRIELINETTDALKTLKEEFKEKTGKFSSVEIDFSKSTEEIASSLEEAKKELELESLELASEAASATLVKDYTSFFSVMNEILVEGTSILEAKDARKKLAEDSIATIMSSTAVLDQWLAEAESNLTTARYNYAAGPSAITEEALNDAEEHYKQVVKNMNDYYNRLSEEAKGIFDVFKQRLELAKADLDDYLMKFDSSETSIDIFSNITDVINSPTSAYDLENIEKLAKEGNQKAIRLMEQYDQLKEISFRLGEEMSSFTLERINHEFELLQQAIEAGVEDLYGVLNEEALKGQIVIASLNEYTSSMKGVELKDFYEKNKEYLNQTFLLLGKKQREIAVQAAKLFSNIKVVAGLTVQIDETADPETQAFLQSLLEEAKISVVVDTSAMLKEGSTEAASIKSFISDLRQEAEKANGEYAIFDAENLAAFYDIIALNPKLKGVFEAILSTYEQTQDGIKIITKEEVDMLEEELLSSAQAVADYAMKQKERELEIEYEKNNLIYEAFVDLQEDKLENAKEEMKQEALLELQAKKDEIKNFRIAENKKLDAEKEALVKSAKQKEEYAKQLNDKLTSYLLAYTPGALPRPSGITDETWNSIQASYEAEVEALKNTRLAASSLDVITARAEVSAAESMVPSYLDVSDAAISSAAFGFSSVQDETILRQAEQDYVDSYIENRISSIEETSAASKEAYENFQLARRYIKDTYETVDEGAKKGGSSTKQLVSAVTELSEALSFLEYELNRLSSSFKKLETMYNRAFGTEKISLGRRLGVLFEKQFSALGKKQEKEVAEYKIVADQIKALAKAYLVDLEISIDPELIEFLEGTDIEIFSQDSLKLLYNKIKETQTVIADDLTRQGKEKGYLDEFGVVTELGKTTGQDFLQKLDAANKAINETFQIYDKKFTDLDKKEKAVINTAQEMFDKEVEIFDHRLEQIALLQEAQTRYHERRIKDLQQELTYLERLKDINADYYYATSLQKYFDNQRWSANNNRDIFYERLNTLPDYMKMYKEETDAQSRAAILDMMEGQLDSMYQQINDLTAYVDNMIAQYSELFQKMVENADRLISKTSNLISLADHYKTILTLLGRQVQQFSDIDIINKTGLAVSEESLKQLKMEYAALQEQLAIASKKVSLATGEEKAFWEERVKEIEDAMESTKESIISTFEDILQRATQIYEDQVNEIWRVWEENLTKGLSFSLFDTMLDAGEKLNEGYLGFSRSIIDMVEIQQKAQELLQSTIKSQAVSQRLKDLAAEAEKKELEARKQGTKVSEYDRDLMQKKLSILEAEIALEEARNSKTSMKLMRDASGNFNYVYAANEDAIAGAQKNLAKAVGEFRETQEEYAANNVKDIIAIQKWAQTEMQNLAKALKEGSITYEQYAIAKEKVLATYSAKLKQYTDLEKQIVSDWSWIEKLYTQYTGEAWTDLYSIVSLGAVKYEEVTNLMTTELLWLRESHQNEMALIKAAIASVENAYLSWQTTTQRVTKEVDSILKLTSQSIQKTMGEISASAAGVTKSLESTLTSYKSFLATAQKEIDVIYSRIIQQIEEMREAARAAAEEIANLLKTASDSGNTNMWEDEEKFSYGDKGVDMITGVDTAEAREEKLKKLGAAASQYAPTNYIQAKINQKQFTMDEKGIIHIRAGDDFAWDGTPEEAAESGAGDKAFAATVQYAASSEEATKALVNWIRKDLSLSLSDAIAVARSWGSKTIAFLTVDQRQSMFKWLDKMASAKAATGGLFTDPSYTSIAEEGPEIVLNAEDTKRILASVQAVRHLTLGALQGLENLTAYNVAASKGEVKQDIVINADFPNATDRDEITAAFDNLFNRAQQYVGG